MNTIENGSTPPPADLAAEYVLGVLDANDRRLAEARIARDAAFSREVAFWEARLMPLLGEIPEVAVPDYVWARIRSALNLAVPARIDRPDRAGLWQSIAFWRGLAGGAFAAATAFAFVVFNTPRPPEPIATESMVSTLADDNGVPGFVAIVDRASARLTITPLTSAPSDGRAPELWLIPEGRAPVSLGLLDPGRAQVLRIPDRMLADLGTGSVFAVTLESPLGAPHAAPAGPVIAKGGIALL